LVRGDFDSDFNGLIGVRLTMGVVLWEQMIGVIHACEALAMLDLSGVWR
jgi:hypothetical protein